MDHVQAPQLLWAASFAVLESLRTVCITLDDIFEGVIYVHISLQTVQGKMCNQPSSAAKNLHKYPLFKVFLVQKGAIIEI
jgi:hypothetical protein